MGSAVYLRAAVCLAGNFPLLAGVDLDVAEGEVVHLRGPNGAGKSSLLRGLAGLAPFVSGEAIVLGHDLVVDRRTVRREIGLLGHASFLYDELTVEDNLRFALRASRTSPRRLESSLERLGLAGRLRSTRVGSLSAGQRRRAAIAVIAARSPRLWLLDEPHAGLDELGRTILDELCVSAATSGQTVILASHEHERAGALASRTVTIAGGQIRAIATEMLDDAPGEPTDTRGEKTEQEVVAGVS
jgi:heme ABC exporter ATP-binding subunit CcmA